MKISMIGRAIRWGMVTLTLIGTHPNSQAANDIIPVQKILSNPNAFHPQDVVLNGALKLVGRWEGKDAVDSPTCGPIFQLEDDTGEIPVLYIIRCD